jgi:hypothetical protein
MVEGCLLSMRGDGPSGEQGGGHRALRPIPARRMPTRCPECGCGLHKLLSLQPTPQARLARRIVWTLAIVISVSAICYQAAHAGAVRIALDLLPLPLAWVILIVLPADGIGALKCACGWQATVLVRSRSS